MKKILSMILICVLFAIYLPFMDTAFANAKIIPMVTAGYDFSAVLKSDGTVWCFGLNESGQLGNGKMGSNSAPVKVLGLSNVISIDSADDYTLALKKDGTVWGWGNNYERGLGEGKPLFCLYAARISGLTKVKAIAAGNGMSIFVRTDGSVWYIMWDDNKASAPRKFNKLKNITAAACKDTYAAALDKNGSVWTWEWDYSLDNEGIDVTEPARAGIEDVKSIAAGEYHYIALKEDGTVWLWGMNNHGEIGDGTRNWCDTPKMLANVADAVKVAAGAYGSMAVLKDGTCLIWGDNTDGQYGNGTRASSLTPVAAEELTGVTSIDGGYEHTIAIKSNGDVMVMGNNHDGMLGIADGTDRLKPYTIMNIKDKTALDTEQGIIYPNGNLGDWTKAEKTVIAADTEGSGNPVGIKAIYAKADQEYLYLAASVTKGIPLSVTFRLDINGDQKQDYSIHFKDSRFTNTYLYQEGNGAYKEIYGVFGDVVEIRIPLSEIGSPGTISVMAEYGQNKDEYGINAEVLSWHTVTGSK